MQFIMMLIIFKIFGESGTALAFCLQYLKAALVLVLLLLALNLTVMA